MISYWFSPVKDCVLLGGLKEFFLLLGFEVMPKYNRQVGRKLLRQMLIGLDCRLKLGIGSEFSDVFTLKVVEVQTAVQISLN